MIDPKCKRCLGKGQVSTPYSNLEPNCFVCAGQGVLPAPDIAELRAYVLSREGIRSHAPMIKYKHAMSYVNKPGPWGKVPKNVWEVQDTWKATVIGRRANYVWMRAREEMGIVKTRFRAYRVEGTKHDPYQVELDNLVNEIVEQAVARAASAGTKGDVIK